MNTESRERYDYIMSSKNVVSDIENLCPDLVDYSKIIRDAYKKEGITHTEKESALIRQCADRLIGDKLIAVTTHELGHNFGLRHNFLGSADAPNFYNAAESKTSQPVQTSSIMEYTSFDQNRLSIPGKYDVAAIMFGYAQKIELQDGTLLDLDPTKSIAENLRAKGARSKRYLYCTDEDYALSMDPMCAPGDQGVSPLEVVNHWVDQYQRSFRIDNYRLDRARIPDRKALSKNRFERYFKPAKRFYDEWRFLLADHLGQDQKYLELLNQEKLNQAIHQLESDPIKGQRAAQYHAAANQAYEFLKRVAFSPNEYCVTLTKPQQTIKLIELSRVREDILRKSENSEEQVRTCSDPKVLDFFEKQSLELTGQFGFPIKDVRYGKLENPANWVIDVLGTESDRQYATATLSSRLLLSPKHQELLFTPNFLDEPQHREELVQLALERALYGVKLGSGDKASYFPLFEEEASSLNALFSNLMPGLAIPSNTSVSASRFQTFSAVQVYNAKLLSSEYSVYTNLGNAIIAASSTANPAAAAAIEIYNSLLRRGEAPPNSAVYAGLIDLLEQLQKSSKIQPELTVKEFLAISRALRSMVEEKSTEMQQFFSSNSTLLNELEAFFLLAQSLQNMSQSNAKFLDNLVVGYLKQVQTDSNSEISIPLFRNQTLDYRKMLMDYLDVSSRQYQEFIENRRDYEAQKNLLIRLLSSGFGSSGQSGANEASE